MLSGAIAAGGVRTGSLSASGAAGAVAVGSLTTAFGGYTRAVLLVSFFVSSSALSRLRNNRHGDEFFVARAGSRDIIQVAANGTVSTLLSIFMPSDRGLLPYVGAIAAVTGDTWATEVGSRWAGTPRHLLTGKPVPAGTSGGISLPGTLASFAGGAFIACVAVAINRFNGPGITDRRLIFGGIGAGAIGSLVDSFVGATIQERRWCPRCRRPTERPVHGCGEPTQVIGGIRGLNNDAVNAICSVTGAFVGYVVARLCHPHSTGAESDRPFH